MKGYIFHNAEVIEKQLRELGFADAGEIVKNVVPVVLSPSMSYAEIDRFYDEQGVAFNFGLRKLEGVYDWNIKMIQAYALLDSDTDERGLLLSKTFYDRDGPFPNKDVMKYAILVLVEQEKTKKERYQYGASIRRKARFGPKGKLSLHKGRF